MTENKYYTVIVKFAFEEYHEIGKLYHKVQALFKEDN